jgi:hypothetical protein
MAQNIERRHARRHVQRVVDRGQHHANAEADTAGALAHRRKGEVRGVVANDTPRSVRLVILRSLYTRE